jgi:hypothetical protein
MGRAVPLAPRGGSRWPARAALPGCAWRCIAGGANFGGGGGILRAQPLTAGDDLCCAADRAPMGDGG